MHFLHKIVLISALALFSLSNAWAQTNSQYSLKIDQVACGISTVHFDIFIKANDSFPLFYLAEQNYRFSFEDQVLANPRIIQELEISGFNADSNFTAFFDPHTLNGSLDTVISYNVVLGGGTGYPIDDTRWYGVGRVEFDLVDPAACMTLKWHDMSIFPPVSIVEKFGGSSGDLFALEEGTYEEFNGCNLACPLEIKTTPSSAEWQTKIFPNPISQEERTTLNFTSSRSTQADIVIFDELGRAVKRLPQAILQGENHLTFDLKSMAAGIYFIQLQDDKGTSDVQKLVKVGN